MGKIDYTYLLKKGWHVNFGLKMYPGQEAEIKKRSKKDPSETHLDQ